MSPMLNALIYIFTDKAVNGQSEALDVFRRSGLMELAEQESIFVAIPCPMNGNSWTEDDYAAYYNIQYILSGGHIEFHGPGTSPILQYTRYVYNNRQFVIGEGSGATFVNNVLTQNCNRIAAVCTFGGNMDSELPAGMPLPIYGVNVCDTAKEYYKKVNSTDTKSDDTELCSTYPLKKDIFTNGADAMTADHVVSAWKRLFSTVARVCVDDNIVCSNLSAKTWVLQQWPNCEALGLSVKEHYVDKYVCYDVVPEGIGKNYPLVISCHGGGDDCLYHIHSCGWTKKCAEEKFLLISPDFPGGTYNDDMGFADFLPIADHIKKVLEYALANYDVDTQRVYIAGFSMGSSVTAATALRYLDCFAACCVMGGTGYNNPWYEHHVKSFKYKYDMPFIIVSGDEDVMSLDVDYKGNPALFGVHSNGLPINGIDRLMEINKLPYECADYEKYPLWGYPTECTVTRVDCGLKYHVGSIYRSPQSAPIAQLITFEGAGHAHSSFFADLCWDFLSQYSRDKNGVIREIKNNYPKHGS